MPKKKPRHGRPALCDAHESTPDYTADELEFMRAVDAYKRSRRRPFPTLTEILDVARALGYRKPG